jgi:gluconate 2-dehydrogenase gamma chain
MKAMRRRTKLSRRKFMQMTAAVAATAPLVSCLNVPSPWRFFSAEEVCTLTAVCERIIPADQDPGAAWAGVVHFLDRQLMGPYKRFRALYRDGLVVVDQTSGVMLGKRFVELPADQQDKVLATLEKGVAPSESWKEFPAKQFFDLVVNHTMQGFYGDPRHGGNREAASWKMLGLPYPPIRGRLHDDLSKGQAG